uniref:Uncharacterized protein n=1 Tax=Romanomermis culicivorax TaxID=13658 RepID=A0A915K7Y4_ROMCU
MRKISTNAISSENEIARRWFVCSGSDEGIKFGDFYTYNDERSKHGELYKNYTEDYGYLK